MSDAVTDAVIDEADRSQNASLFTRRWVVIALATLCCLLWGSAYPAIKNGYALFHIAATDVPSKMVFAGYRFVFAGALLLLMSAVGGRRILVLSRKNWREVALLGVTQTSIQYVFFYIGLA